MKKLSRKIFKISDNIKITGVISLFITIFYTTVSAQIFPRLSLTIEKAQKPEDVAIALQILFLITILALAPSILIMGTSFVRIVIVLSFLRRAVGTQTMPPDQIMVGLALFLTFFIMAPVFTEINENVLQPYLSRGMEYTE